MTSANQDEIRDLLKRSIPTANTELPRDLWPQMLRRIEAPPRSNQIPWFDWALAGVLVALVCAFPGSIPLLLYHL